MKAYNPMIDAVADEVIDDSAYYPLPADIEQIKTSALELAIRIAGLRAINCFYDAELLEPRLFAIGYKADPEVTEYVKVLMDTLRVQKARREPFELISNDDIDASLKMLEAI